MDHPTSLTINLHYVLEGQVQIWHSQTPPSAALESEEFTCSFSTSSNVLHLKHMHVNT